LGHLAHYYSLDGRAEEVIKIDTRHAESVANYVAHLILPRHRPSFLIKSAIRYGVKEVGGLVKKEGNSFGQIIHSIGTSRIIY